MNSSNITTANNFRYCGEQFDPETGMYYLRARYFNPQTGRFWTMDTCEGDQGDPQSLHKYLYVRGDPVNKEDPSGCDPFEVMGIDSVLEGLGSLTGSVMRWLGYSPTPDVEVRPITHLEIAQNDAHGTKVQLLAILHSKPKYPEYRWIQEVKTDEPIYDETYGSAPKDTWYKDPYGHPSPYLFDSDVEAFLRSKGRGRGGYSMYEDTPRRHEGHYWQARGAFVGVRILGGDLYDELVRFEYGFTVRNGRAILDPLIIRPANKPK